MEKKFGSLIFLIILIGVTSASININEPAEIYNLGDTIHTTIAINPSEIKGNFELKLVCGDNSEVFYKISPAESAFIAGQEIKINHKIILERQYIKNLIGECQIQANLGDLKGSTKNFKITSEILVNVKTDKESYDPGENIIIDLSASKPNGNKFQGNIKFTGLFELEKIINESTLIETLRTDKTLEAGEYNIFLYLFDKDKNNEILNSNNSTLNIKINQIAYSVPLTLRTLELNPGESLDFQAELFDQSGKDMDGQILIEFISPLNEKIQLRTYSKDSGALKFPTNATAGDWKIYSSYGNIREERTIKINSRPLLVFDFLEESSIINIKNIGNANFIETINITLEDEPIELKLNIKPGEERKFTLTAPNGEYNVRIDEGDTRLEKRVLLTGKVVAVKENTNLSIISNYPAITSIIVTLIILLGIILFFRYNKTTFRLERKFKDRIKNLRSDSNGKNLLGPSGSSRINTAEACLVISGSKEPATIVSIKIKNEFGHFTKENLEKILKELAQKNNAFIDLREKDILLIFSPRKTKSYKNEYSAIRMSLDINKLLQESNHKFNEKINFGIGISSGDLISIIENNKLKYMGVGNTISSAKKIADISCQEIIITTQVKDKLLRDLKTEKVEKNGDTYYKVLRLSEIENNKDKLKDLLKRTHLE
jgi:hypothetical protein